MIERPIPVARPRRHLTEAQRLAWLRLIRSENIGPVTFRDLLNQFGGAQAALDALPELSRRGGRKGALRVCSHGEAEHDLARAQAAGAHLAAIDEPGYPALLAVIEAPPPLLYLKGRLDIAAMPIVAIVGARDASAAGRKIAGVIAGDLGRGGIAVVSGLARGIDTAAHNGALATGTIAVVAGGIDIAYPPENAQLQSRIGVDGLLVAECAPGLEPRGRDFPRRNRIISGTADAVLVVEAALKSGSRITAGYARAQGRKVFAVPGNPLDPRAGGTNQLLKQGAGLVTSAADILAALGQLPAAPDPPNGIAESSSEPPATPPSILQSDRERIVEALGPAPIGLDDLVRLCGLTAQAVRVVLLELDIAGRLDRSAGQRIALKP